MATKDFKSMIKSNPRSIKPVEEPIKPVDKKSVGRPPLDPDGRKKKEYTKTINVAVPLDTLEKIQIAKVKYGDNLTKYINTLIEKDLEANYETYKTIYNMLNN